MTSGHFRNRRIKNKRLGIFSTDIAPGELFSITIYVNGEIKSEAITNNPKIEAKDILRVFGISPDATINEEFFK